MMFFRNFSKLFCRYLLIFSLCVLVVIASSSSNTAAPFTTKNNNSDLNKVAVRDLRRVNSNESENGNVEVLNHDKKSHHYHHDPRSHNQMLRKIQISSPSTVPSTISISPTPSLSLSPTPSTSQQPSIQAIRNLQVSSPSTVPSSISFSPTPSLSISPTPSLSQQPSN